MIGLLFHGPEIFDTGWAARLMQAFPNARRMLAGTMSRTALFDSGLQGIEAPGTMCSPAAQQLSTHCDPVLLATCSKSTEAGLANYFRNLSAQIQQMTFLPNTMLF